MSEQEQALTLEQLSSYADRDPWERLPDEPSRWYERFDLYRLLGPTRALRVAYRRYRELRGMKDLRVGSGIPPEWAHTAKQWLWKERAELWDAHCRMEQERITEEVMNEGLALSYQRVEHLKRLAAKIEATLLDPKRNSLSPYMIEQYRGILDDIAREKGERQREMRWTGPGGGPVQIETQWGRGGSATEAWQGASPPLLPPVEAIVTELKADEDAHDETGRA